MKWEGSKENPLYVAIVGSGFAGLCMGTGLAEREQDNFLIFETADDLGGTWRDNTYPGCGCDVRSHLYSFSFFPKPDWSRSYSKQEEIWEYMKAVAKEYGLYPHFRFSEGIEEARWDAKLQLWQLTSSLGNTYFARFLVTGTGGLSIPNYPEIEGLQDFEGKVFHSARWDHSFDLRGKRVGVIGTGASAVQFVPQIAPEAGKLTLFQRTPPWILPKPDKTFSPSRKSFWTRFPFFRWLNREAIYWQMEASTPAFVRWPGLHQQTRRMALRHLKKQVSDPELRKKLTPSYLPGCKRLLPSNNYYPAICRDNVQLHTDGIQAIQKEGILDKKGNLHPADLIILATGFKATSFLSQVQILGEKGISLHENWADKGSDAYLGTMVSGFPNLFMFTGPNTGLGNNSMIHIMESQANLIFSSLDYLRQNKLNCLSPKAEVQIEYNQKLQKKLQKTVWNTGGCQSWYLREDGKNVTLWPGSTASFRRKTKRIHPEKYRFA